MLESQGYGFRKGFSIVVWYSGILEAVGGSKCHYVENTSQTGESVAEKIRLLIIEDNLLLREGLSTIIRNQPDIKLVSEKGSKTKPLRMIRELKPRVLLLDLGLRNQSSLELVKTVRLDLPETKEISHERSRRNQGGASQVAHRNP